MGSPSARHLLVAVIVGLTVAACSDEAPPDWLESLAVEEASSTTVAATPTTAGPTTTLAAGNVTAALEVEKGTCLVDVPFIDGDPVEVLELRTVRCREPHQAEIYDVVQLPQQRGAAFPGSQVAQQARRQCRARFETFVGIPWTASELEFATLRPTAESWDEGDRAIVCALFRPDGKDLEGTTRNARY